MADVVVVGAGLAGMAVAARLSKQGHHVTVIEQADSPGGALQSLSRDGFTWEQSPSAVALPAVLRDLFRKSGRPLENYVELTLREVARRHVFADHATVDLPTGSRGAQISAVDAGLGAGSGHAWADFVDSRGEVWDLLRSEVLDVPTGGASFADRRLRSSLQSSTSLAKLLARAFKDERLRQIVADSLRAAGSDTRAVPAFGAVEAYVERSFGVWDVTGGLESLRAALVTRLAERKVELCLGSAATEIEVAAGAVAGVRTAAGDRVAADIVVTAIDPRRVFGGLLRAAANPQAHKAFSAATPALPPATTHLGLQGDVATLPPEVVWHGDPLLVLHTNGCAPEGHHAWTVQSRGGGGEDVVVTLARRGLDVRQQVVARVDRSPGDLATDTAGSSYGLAWDGWRAHARRAAILEPVVGVHLIGAGVHPGASIPYAAWGAAHVAARIGKA